MMNMNIKIMTAILESTHLSKDLRELPESLQQWIKETNVLQEMWENNLLTFDDHFYHLKGGKVKKPSKPKWESIKAKIKLDGYTLAEVNKQCGARFLATGRTEGLLNTLSASYDDDKIALALSNVLNLKMRNGEGKFIAGLDTYLTVPKISGLLELEEERSEFKWS